MGKHRTEVTEATEEGFRRLGAKRLAGDTTASGASNTPKGKASHRGHGGHRGGSEVRGQNCSPGYHRSGARNTRKRKGSHRGHGGHGEAIGVVGECANGDTVGLGKKNNRRSAFRVLRQCRFFCVWRFLSVNALACFAWFAALGSFRNLLTLWRFSRHISARPRRPWLGRDFVRPGPTVSPAASFAHQPPIPPLWPL